MSSLNELKDYAEDMRWMQKIRQLEAAYATDGRAALAKMTGVEAYVLYEEKFVALAAAELMLEREPGHQRWMLRRTRLKAEVGEILGCLKERSGPPCKGKDHGRER